MAEEIIGEAIEKVEITVRQQLTGMITKLGEYVALAIPGLIGIVLTTGIVPVDDFVTWLISLGFLFCAVILFAFLYKNNQFKKQWESDMIEVAKRKMEETDEHNTRLSKVEAVNVELQGTIDSLKVDNDDLRETNLAAFKQLNDMMRKVIALTVSGDMMDQMIKELEHIEGADQ